MPAAQRLPLLLFALAHNASMGKDRLALFVIVDHDFRGYSEYGRSVAGSSAELRPALPICRSDAVMMLVIECCVLSMISYDITRAGQSPAWPGAEYASACTFPLSIPNMTAQVFVSAASSYRSCSRPLHPRTSSTQLFTPPAI